MDDILSNEVLKSGGRLKQEIKCMNFIVFHRILYTVNVWCDYDGCDSPQVNVGIYICDEKINEASDYLYTVN